MNLVVADVDHEHDDLFVTYGHSIPFDGLMCFNAA
jgi:hypothetical protein